MAKCTLLELTMANPVAVGGGSSADISLIDPHTFSVATRIERVAPASPWMILTDIGGTGSMVVADYMLVSGAEVQPVSAIHIPPWVILGPRSLRYNSVRDRVNQASKKGPILVREI
ncbi:hypothetical protein B0H15DRAFT_848869, partial [Mycena belliarum]